jgi:hypothetical protein
MICKGGLLTGKDPSAFNTSDPLRLWIIQVGEFALVFATLVNLKLPTAFILPIIRGHHSDDPNSLTRSAKDAAT